MRTPIPAAEPVVRRAFALGALVFVALALLPAQAEAQERRACRATGYFIFTFDEQANGAVVTRTKRIDILRSDMEVVANAPGLAWKTVTDAKRVACGAAADCFVSRATGSPQCNQELMDVVFETVQMPQAVDEFRRQVACNHARAGSVPGLRRTGTNTVTLTKTKIVATGSRDGITRHADRTVNESVVCWGPEPSARPGEKPAPGRRKPEPGGRPSRTDSGHRPSRTDSGHRPSRTDPDHAPTRTNPPSPIADIQVTVKPQEQRGKCPATVTMQARLKLREPAEVRWWVTGEDGYESPKYVRSFTKPDANVIWRRHIDPKPTTGGLTQKPGSKPSAPIHRGYFQLHFETVSDQRAMPLGTSKRVPFTVDCNPASTNRIKRQ